MLIDKLPILAVCVYSGSGETTLIVEIINRLAQCGLKIAVFKHSSSRLELDKAGKDSDRFFLAGAHVYLSNDRQSFVRYRPDGSPSFSFQLQELSRYYDLILVEGYKHTDAPKVWLLGADELAPPSECTKIMAVLPRGSSRMHLFMVFFEVWYKKIWQQPPVFGCLLIGGKSSRMGQPKHLIVKDGKSWLTGALEKLEAVCEKVVIAGSGDLPSECRVDRLPDPPLIKGPMAGIIGAMRWHPWAVWLMVACDLPDLSGPALRWLIEQRRPGRWVALPAINGQFAEPLLACYDFRSQPFLEEMATSGDFRLHNLKKYPKVDLVKPPQSLRGSWRNVNYADEI